MADPTKRQQKTERIAEPLDFGVSKAKVYLERRNDGPNIYARVWIQGAYKIHCLGTPDLKEARKAAGQWFIKLYNDSQKGHLHGPLFSDVAEEYVTWLDKNMRGELSDGQIRNLGQKWTLLRDHSERFFLGKRIDEIDHPFLVRLRDQRKRDKNKRGEVITNATVEKDLQFVRAALRYAKDHRKCLEDLPTFPTFRGVYAVDANPTPFLSLGQYLAVITEAKTRAFEPDLNPRTRRQRQEMLCWIMMSVCAALRPGEAAGLRWCDCQKMRLKVRSGETLDAIKMSVFGKHGRSKNKREEGMGLYHAVEAYKFLESSRPEARTTDRIFLEDHADGLEDVLDHLGLLKVQREARVQHRSAESFRHTGISLMRLYSVNPSIDDIADWARTSPEMIRKFYDQNPLETAVQRIALWRGHSQGAARAPTQDREQPRESTTDAMTAGLAPWELEQDWFPDVDT